MTLPKVKPMVFVSLGSNIEPERNISQAVKMLRGRTVVRGVSPVYQTPPIGFNQQADFLNVVVMLTTMLDASTLKHDVLEDIERELGRERDPYNKFGPRTIDADIILWGDQSFEYGRKPWAVPDPEILRYSHLAVPLADLAPEMVYPGTTRTFAQIASSMYTKDMKLRDDLKL